jgi:hypothetical protein
MSIFRLIALIMAWRTFILRYVIVELWEECPEVKEALIKAVNDHPNHPRFTFPLDKRY